MDLNIGPALRRFRRLNAVKQAHAAELLGVTQTTISRWENGSIRPEGVHSARIERLVRAGAANDADAALKRLVETSSMPVHLVCDATHTLLAASRPRLATWNASIVDFVGRSLWPFASAEIMVAEAGLAADGWFERPFGARTFRTGSNKSEAICVRPSTMRWEQILLSDGRVGRLTTTVADHA